MRKDMGSKKTCKERGEWAELCFMARAADRGLNVSRPHGDSASYDVGVEQNGRFLRIQVKSTTFCRKGSYTSNITGPKHERYPRGKVDFFAVYLVPVDVWYIIPFDVVEGNLSLNLTPRKGHKFAQYMEGWNLLRGAGKKARKKMAVRDGLRGRAIDVKRRQDGPPFPPDDSDSRDAHPRYRAEIGWGKMRAVTENIANN